MSPIKGETAFPALIPVGQWWPTRVRVSHNEALAPWVSWAEEYAMRNFFGCIGLLMVGLALMALPAILFWGLFLVKASLLAQ